jgi:hypothetical protein
MVTLSYCVRKFYEVHLVFQNNNSGFLCDKFRLISLDFTCYNITYLSLLSSPFLVNSPGSLNDIAFILVVSVKIF